jgi:phage terminase Nu1 subunit (DNA packaging protein)
MAKPENPKNFSAMGVSDVAALLNLTDRQVRNLISDKGLPAKSDPRGYILDWFAVLEWWVEYRGGQKPGNAGNRRPGNATEPPEIPDETYEQALARKTRAEADLKELQLAREQGEVAAIGDVEKALASANAATKTLIQALPSRLSTQLLGIDDRTRLYSILERETNGLLGNLATVKSVFEIAAKNTPQEDEE